MEQASKEEQLVMSLLLDVENLLEAVMSNPLAYECHVPAIMDIIAAAAEAKAAVLAAMTADSFRDMSEITQAARLKLAGL